ncbi:MAG: hypothetical protein UZ14_CFX002002103 [Chloroflexi bacterium OLB14]|nr:MAG: hypothetical protein UZ14_CFX002002103 [Chloroflexi bacterium OLB14]
MSYKLKAKTEGRLSNMKKLKENKPLKIILLIVLIVFLPQQLLFWKLCTEQDRNIPPNTEVLVSACKNPFAIGVPSGEVLFVYEERFIDKMYLLDLRTKEKRKVPNDPLLLERGIFLNSELVWLEGSLVGPGENGYRPHYILDLVDGKRYELLDLDTLPRLEGGKFDPKNYVYIQSAQYIYIHHSKNTLIALSSDFRTSPNGRVILSQYALEIGADSENGKAIEELIKGLGLSYEIVDFSLRYTSVISPKDNYIIKNDGIILPTGKIIANQEFGGYYDFGYFRSWFYDESGVVVQSYSDYLFSSTLGPSFFLIPKPILKLGLP